MTNRPSADYLGDCSCGILDPLDSYYVERLVCFDFFDDLAVINISLSIMIGNDVAPGHRPSNSFSLGKCFFFVDCVGSEAELASEFSFPAVY